MTEYLQKTTVSKDYVDNILNSMIDTLVVVTSEGVILTVNQATCDLLGYKAEELIGQPVATIFAEEELLVASELFNLIEKGFISKVEKTYLKTDSSTIPMLFSGSVIRDDDGNIQIVYVAQDITERKHAEEEKEKIQAQLLHAQKMEAIGRLAGGVAHDFNNLLTAIIGHTDLAMMKVDEANPLYGDLKQIRLAAAYAADLTRQLLLFGRKQPMEFSSLDINRTIDNLLKMLNRLIGEDIAIKVDLEPNLWVVMADEGNIEQVIMNLAVNARDAMPEGGKLTIKTENVTIGEEDCKVIPEAREGKFVCLSVADTGVGMNKEIIGYIFEPFFTTKEAGKGTGLGLSVVYGIVKQHGGWITVFSEPGLGSTFNVYLPAFSVKKEDETKETISLHKLGGSGERILLVEDEERVREFLTEVLSENGYVVFEAATAQEALDIFEKEKRNFHLVFSDVVLPDKTGLQLVDKLFSLKPELKVLLGSGYTDSKSQWDLIYERGLRFIQKPYALFDLLRAIREVV